MRYVWLMGLLLACGSAICLVVLPIEVALMPGFVVLVSGVALFAVGVCLRFRQHKVDIGAAMKCFAETHGAGFQGVLPVDRLPEGISLFGRGERQRCTNAITIEGDTPSCLLFRFEYYASHPDGQGTWHDRYVAWAPAALPQTTKFRIRSRFSHRDLLLWVVISGLLVATGSFMSFAATASSAALITGLLLSALFFIIGGFTVLIARWRSHPAAAPDFLDGAVLDSFARHGLCAECSEGHLVVWCDRTIGQLWRTGWRRSFIPVDAWITAELRNLLEAVNQVVSLAALRHTTSTDTVHV